MNKKTIYRDYRGGMNDLDLARYFIEHHKQDVRWLVEKECWLYFDGTRWREDDYKVKALMQETLSAVASLAPTNAMNSFDLNRLKMTERYRAVLDAIKIDEMTI